MLTEEITDCEVLPPVCSACGRCKAFNFSILSQLGKNRLAWLFQLYLIGFFQGEAADFDLDHGTDVFVGRPGLYGVCVSDGGARSLVHHPPVGLLISLPEPRAGVDIPRSAGAGVPDYGRYCYAPEPEGRAA